VAIDLFFRTLAETHGPNAAAVVLSGTGSDGASGLKRVKELGGVTFAQDPQDAEYDSMPRNAIATGLVDYVLPAAAMPEQMLEYIGNGEKIRLPPADQAPLADQPAALRDISRVAARAPATISKAFTRLCLPDQAGECGYGIAEIGVCGRCASAPAGPGAVARSADQRDQPSRRRRSPPWSESAPALQQVAGPGGFGWPAAPLAGRPTRGDAAARSQPA
jgi:hypothetical protein